MAHFAQLDNWNKVIQVIVINNEAMIENGIENPEKGEEICKQLFGHQTRWVQTSYNENFRKNYAGAGCTYDAIRDAFIPIKPYNSWILNENTCRWEPPTPCPDVNYYEWNEKEQKWVSRNVK
jgi:hypothetical protein